MSSEDEFRCPEGWEISPYGHLDGSKYIYKVLRRKKRKSMQEKSMPEIRVGDTIRYDDRMRHVHAVDGEHIQFFDPDGRSNSWKIDVFVRHYDAAVFRAGVKIWEHDR